MLYNIMKLNMTTRRILTNFHKWAPRHFYVNLEHYDDFYIFNVIIDFIWKQKNKWPTNINVNRNESI